MKKMIPDQVFIINQRHKQNETSFTDSYLRRDKSFLNPYYLLNITVIILLKKSSYLHTKLFRSNSQGVS